MKIETGASILTLLAILFTADASSVWAGGCCQRCGTQDPVRYGCANCCPGGRNGWNGATPESGRRESVPARRSVGYVVESAPVLAYGVMPMMMPLAFQTPGAYRGESAWRPESSELDRGYVQLTKDVAKLSQEVEKLIQVVDKQGLAIEAIVKRLEEKKPLEK